MSDLVDGKDIEKLFLEFDEHKTKESIFAYNCDKLECDLQCKLYDEETNLKVDKEEYSKNVHDETVVKLFEQNMRWSEMWLTYSQMKYNYDKNFMAVLRQSEACVRKYQTNTGLHVKDMEDELRGSIMKEASILIDKIGSEKVGEKECEVVNEKIKNVTEKKIAELEKYLSEQVEEMNNEIQDVLSSDMANFVFSEINSGKISINAKTIKDFTDFSEKSGKVIKGVQTATKKATRMAVTKGGKATGDLTKMSTISGTQMHELVTQVGHFFGKSFKPWEAVHIAAK